MISFAPVNNGLACYEVQYADYRLALQWYLSLFYKSTNINSQQQFDVQRVLVGTILHNICTRQSRSLGVLVITTAMRGQCGNNG